VARPEERLFGGLRVLSEEEIERIDRAAREVLRDTGVIFEDPEARDALEGIGARVAPDGRTVRFPEGVVRRVLESAPARVVLGARDPEQALELGRRRMLTTNGFGTSRVWTGQRRHGRDATADDLRDLTRLADGLEPVDICQHQVTPQDVPPHLLDVVQAFIVLSNTGKHAHLSTYSAEFLDEVIEMGRIASDGAHDPAFSLGCCALSPLRYAADATCVLRRAAGEGIPFLLVSGAVAGVMAPVTLAGALVVQTAELLAGLALAQAVNEGAPVAFGSFTSPMDPRSGQQRLGAAELPLLNGATAQLCAHYGVPMGYGTGGISDAPAVGIQAGIEKALTVSLAALSGVEVVHDAVSGIVAGGLMVSYEAMVIEAELCRIVRRFLRGVDVSEASLGMQQIQSTGPGGSFLTNVHTARHLREELLISDLWESGDGDGDTGILERAHDKASRLIASHSAVPLSSEQSEGMMELWNSVGLDKGKGRALLSLGNIPQG